MVLLRPPDEPDPGARSAVAQDFDGKPVPMGADVFQLVEH